MKEKVEKWIWEQQKKKAAEQRHICRKHTDVVLQLCCRKKLSFADDAWRSFLKGKFPTETPDREGSRGLGDDTIWWKMKPRCTLGKCKRLCFWKLVSCSELEVTCPTPVSWKCGAKWLGASANRAFLVLIRDSVLLALVDIYCCEVSMHFFSNRAFNAAAFICTHPFMTGSRMLEWIKCGESIPVVGIEVSVWSEQQLCCSLWRKLLKLLPSNRRGGGGSFV